MTLMLSCSLQLEWVQLSTDEMELLLFLLFYFCKII